MANPEALYGDRTDRETKLNEFIDRLYGSTMMMNEHKGRLFLEGLEKHLELVLQEESSATTAGFYKRGQVVHVQLGFNVGSEEGGGRPAVVLWTEPTAGTVTIVPITSLKPEKAARDATRSSHVNLGELLRPDMIAIAKVQQIRAVSKLRVSPWGIVFSSGPMIVSLSNEHLDAIDSVLTRMYTRAKP